MSDAGETTVELLARARAKLLAAADQDHRVVRELRPLSIQ